MANLTDLLCSYQTTANIADIDNEFSKYIQRFSFESEFYSVCLDVTLLLSYKLNHICNYFSHTPPMLFYITGIIHVM